MLKNKRNIAIAGAIGILIVIFLIVTGSGKSDASDIMVAVSKGEFVVDVNTTGELEAKNSTKINGPSGLRNYRIYQVNIQNIIDEGTYVEKGDYVARLDPSELTTRIKDTQLEVDEKSSQFEQTQLDTTLIMREARDELINLEYAVEEKELILEQSKYEPPATIKQAEIDLDKAKRAFKQAKENYDIKRRQNVAKMKEVAAQLTKVKLELEGMDNLASSFTITAPEPGMLIYRKGWDGKPIKEGSQISAWDPIVATLPDLSSMNSVTYVNEVDIRRIATGQKVDIGLDAFPDKKLTGVVKRVANVGEQRPNSDAKVFQVTIEIDRIDESLRPGMTTSNKIYTNVINETLYVPLECLHSFADSVTYVYAKDGMSYIKQEVQIGETNANSVQILAGLSDRQQVYLSIPNGNGEDISDIKLLEELNGKRNQVTEPEPTRKREKPQQREGFGKRKPRA